MKSLVTSVVLSLAAVVCFANEGHGPKIAECQASFAACEAAGFKPGAHHKGEKMGAGSGLWVDCIKAVADGKKEVAGVDKAAAQACLDAKKAHKKANH